MDTNQLGMDQAHNVASEVAAGDALTFPQLAKLAPSTRMGRPPHQATVLRWALSGVTTRQTAT